MRGRTNHHPPRSYSRSGSTAATGPAHGAIDDANIEHEAACLPASQLRRQFSFDGGEDAGHVGEGAPWGGECAGHELRVAQGEQMFKGA